MKKLYLLITLILLSCSKSENKENFNSSKKLSITIGNENFEVINDKVNANENCDNIFVTASPTLINDLGFMNGGYNCILNGGGQYIYTQTIILYKINNILQL